jgi:hypothetical protein
VGEFFRRDVYVKGARQRAVAATNVYLDTTAWGLPTAQVERVVRLPQRTVCLEGATFDALFAALAEGAATIPVLAERTGLALEDLRAAIARLVVADQAVPLLAPTRAAAAGDMFGVPSVYNQAMLRRLSSDAPIVLASNVAGTAYPISALDALALRLFTEVAPGERERWVDDLVLRSVLRIRIGDRVLVDRADQRRAILDAAEQLRLNRLAKLVELGILVEA